MTVTVFMKSVLLCIIVMNSNGVLAEVIGVVDGRIYWEIVLKLETGGPFRAYTMYSDAEAVRHYDNITMGRIDINTGDHYKSTVANEWNNVEKVKVSIYANKKETAFFVFDARGSNMVSWFRRTYVLNSSYTLPAHMYSFNLQGFRTKNSFRSFTVMKSYDGCNRYKDLGFLCVLEESLPQPCNADKADATKIYYSRIPGASAVYDLADSMTISIARDDFSGYRYTADLTVLYKVIHQSMRKEKGIALCEKDGGRLFRITSINKLTKVTRDLVVNNKTGGYFVDGSDRDEEGNWKFSNGEPIPDSVVSVMSKYFDNYAGIEFVLELKVGDQRNTFNDLREGERRNILCEIPVSCEHPPSVAKGTVADGGNNIWARRNITCNKGFTPQPDTFLTCDLNGEWSGGACVIAGTAPILCDLTTLQLREGAVIINITGSMENMTVQLGCKRGYMYKVTEADHVIYCNYGMWIKSPLVCKEIPPHGFSVDETIKKLRSQLRIWNNSTTKYQRTKISAEDHRLSSKYIGITLGACVLATLVLLVVLSDACKYICRC